MPRHIGRIPGLYPESGEEGQHWIYLVGGKDERVKVGRTTTPRARILTHRRAFGDNFAWCHLFVPMMGRGKACTAEHVIKRRLEQLGTRVGATETYLGIGKRAAIDGARQALADRAEVVAETAEWHLRHQYADQAWDAFKAQFPGLVEAL